MQTFKTVVNDEPDAASMDEGQSLFSLPLFTPLTEVVSPVLEPIPDGGDVRPAVVQGRGWRPVGRSTRRGSRSRWAGGGRGRRGLHGCGLCSAAFVLLPPRSSLPFGRRGRLRRPGYEYRGGHGGAVCVSAFSIRFMHVIVFPWREKKSIKRNTQNKTLSNRVHSTHLLAIPLLP